MPSEREHYVAIFLPSLLTNQMAQIHVLSHVLKHFIQSCTYIYIYWSDEHNYFFMNLSDELIAAIQEDIRTARDKLDEDNHKKLIEMFDRST